MPDLDFSSFNYRSFEQFAQALAVSVFGPGTLIFGDGPDGGREAAFTGRAPYPNEAAVWVGHVVMQAKFRLKPHGDARDADWLVQQLRAEMSKLEEDVTLRRPDLYVLVTNVALSGVPATSRGSGGQAKLDAAFESYCRPLGIGRLDVWHADKVAVLLDAAPDLARSYSAWTAPREVLSAALRFFDGSRPSFGQTMLRYLQRELRSQRATRMQQAGHVGAQIALEDVFVDLPCGVDEASSRAHVRFQRGLTGHDLSPTLVVGSLLERLALKLDPETLAASWPAAGGPAPNRHVVLGGPGQGKSTITQFLGQVMRSRILSAYPGASLSPDVSGMVRAVEGCMQSAGLRFRGVARYPIRVDLPTFADALAKARDRGTSHSILAHIAGHITLVADEEVAVSDLREWMKGYPWLLLLDGLDEVPASGGRGAVLEALVSFWDEATPLNADVAVIVTSRQQGYNDDLDPKAYLKLELAKLDAERALAYAARLASVATPDPERGTRIIERLTAASRSATTALLMVSPLQVAIMFQLVDLKGQAPTGRWTLFDDYLKVVVDREVEKPGPIGELVRRHSRVLQSLLRRAGLLLHVEAERSGAASSHLTPARLNELMTDLLVEDGHSPETIPGMVSEIAEAATNRLVILEQRVTGQIAFEVRSLQEFMAAAELMSGEDGHVRARLGEIAARTHWQHVYLIAASKAFAVNDAERFRDTFVATHRSLDASSPGPAAVCAGASLSLALLEDGIAFDQPTYRRMLAVHALETLRLGPSQPMDRLAAVIAELGAGFARLNLAAHVGSSSKQERVATWLLILAVLAKGAMWSDDLALEFWPTDGDKVLEALTSGAVPREGTFAAGRFELGLAGVRPSRLDDALRVREYATVGFATRPIYECYPFVRALREATERQSLEIGVLSSRQPILRMGVVKLADAVDNPAYDAPDSPAWRAMSVVRAFLADPTPRALGVFASLLTDEDLRLDLRPIRLPWILETVLALAYAGRDPATLSRNAEAGLFGDAKAWVAAEERWTEKGFCLQDLRMWATGEFFAKDVAVLGAPPANSIIRTVGVHEPFDWLSTLIEGAVAASEGPPRDTLRFMIRQSLPGFPIAPMPAVDAMPLLIEPTSMGFTRLNPDLLPYVDPDTIQPVDFEMLDRLGRQALVRVGGPEGQDAPGLIDVLTARVAGLPGLIVVLLAMLAERPDTLVDVATSMNDVLLVARESDSASIRRSAELLLLAGDRGDVDRVASQLFTEDIEFMEHHVLISLIRHGLIGDQDAGSLLTKMVTRLDVGAAGLLQEAISLLKAALDRESSGLNDQLVWSSLGLPATLFLMIDGSSERKSDLTGFHKARRH